MNLLPINNTLTQADIAPAYPTVGAISNPLAQLVALGKTPPRGAQSTRQFEQILASALAEVMSRTSMFSSSEKEDSTMPNLTNSLMPASLSLTLGQINNWSTKPLEAQLPPKVVAPIETSQGGAAP